MTDECPNCGEKTNSSTSRLIKDTCGHEKCRMCLLYEEQGCKACSQLEKSSAAPDENSKIEEKSAKPQEKEAQSSPPSPKKPEINSPPKSSTVPYKPKKSPDRSHIITLGEFPERYKCTLCSKIFLNKKGKCYHDGCLTGVQPYHCKICERTFVKKSHYEYHERVHSGYKPFKCELCPKAFPQKNKLNRHMQSHSKEKKYLCPKNCGKRYNKKDDLKIHMMLHTGTMPHVCSTCGKCFRVRTSLNRHMQIHSTDRPHTCSECSKSFKDKSLLIRHRRTHGKERPYSCAHCPRVFLSKSELKRHIYTHSDVKPFSCEFCQTVFRRKDNLNRHIRHHHSADSPVVAGGSERGERVETRKKRGEKAGEGKKREKPKRKTGNPQTVQKDSCTQINSRLDARGNITPVIRAPGELSNAVPVINGPISMKRSGDKEVKKTTLTFTEPIPIAEAAVINQRIEQKLYPHNLVSSGTCYFSDRSSREPHIPIPILPPLRHNSAVRAVPIGSRGGGGGGRRMSDSNFSPPKNGTLIELKSGGGGGDGLIGEGEGEGDGDCVVVMERRIVGGGGEEKAEGTNCVSTIKKNLGFEGGEGVGSGGKTCETHWRRRTAENLKPHLI